MQPLASGETLEWCLNDLPPDVLAGLERERLPLALSFVVPERQPAKAGEAPDASPELPGLMLVFTAVCEADVYVPRSLGTVRHGNEFLERTRSAPGAPGG